MTDNNESYLRDLEEAASAVGGMPNEYAELRSILETLPRGTAPDVRASGSGAAAVTGSGSSGSALTLISPTPIGSESGIAAGVSQAPTLGLRNLFEDARLQSVPFGSVGLSGVTANISREWTGLYSAGATGASSTAFKGSDYDDNTVDPFQSSTMILRFNNWTGAGTAIIEARADRQGGFFAAFDATVLPFAVFSCDIFKDIAWNQQFNNVTSTIVELVIRDGGDTVDLAVSTPIDYKNMGLGAYVRHSVSIDSAELSGGGIIPLVRITLVTSGALGGGNMNPAIANPQLEISPYQVPFVFLESPRDSQLISWLEGGTAAIIIADPGDNTAAFRSRLSLGLSSVSEGQLIFGSGAATNDVRLRRPTGIPNVLRLDNNSTGRASLEAYAGTGPGTPAAGIGRRYFRSATKTWHGVDGAGIDTDLAAGGGGGLPGGVPALVFTTVNAGGAAGTAVRTDASIAIFDATNPSTQAFADAAVVGVAAFAARRDHKHAMMAAPTQVSNSAVSAAADYVARIKIAADTTFRAFLGLDAGDLGSLEFGPGGVAVRDFSIRRTGAGAVTIDALGVAATSTVVTIAALAAQAAALDLKQTADAGRRLRLRGDSSSTGMFLSGGGIPLDIALERSAASTLKIHGNAFAGPFRTIVETTAGQTVALDVQVAGDTVPRVNIRGDATETSLQLGTGAAAADIRIRRLAANVLRLDDGGTGRASLEMYEGAGPGTPGAGLIRLYASSATSSFHQIDDAGVDTDLAAAAGVATQVSNSAVSGAADYVARIKIAADTTFRAFLGLDASDRGALEFGPGGVAARDVRLYRSAAKAATFDDDAGAAATLILAGAGVFQFNTASFYTLSANGGTLAIKSAAATDLVAQFQAPAGQINKITQVITGESFERVHWRGDATTTGFLWGDGTAAPDVAVYRSAANEWASDDNLRFTGANGTVFGNAGTDTVLFQTTSGTLRLQAVTGSVANTGLRIMALAGKTSALDLHVSGDSPTQRTSLRGDATETSLRFGSGAAALDLRVRRSAAKTIAIDDNAAGPITTRIQGTVFLDAAMLVQDYDPGAAAGSYTDQTIETGAFAIFGSHLILSSTRRLDIVGTGRLLVHG